MKVYKKLKMEQIIYENHHLEDILTIAVCLKIDPQQMSLGFLLDFLLFVYRTFSRWSKKSMFSDRNIRVKCVKETNK